jgi:hypothetical protein
VPRPLPNRVGERHGKLVVTARATRLANGFAAWSCICDCGGRRTVSNDKIAHILACKACSRSSRLSAHTTHGQNGTPTYFAWQKMKGRCRNKNNNRYRYYGAEGVRVCVRWLKFDNFLAVGWTPKRAVCTPLLRILPKRAA